MEHQPLSAEPIDLVALDLDGTLLKNDGSLSRANIEAVSAAVKLGVKVVLATARPPRGCVRVYRDLGLDTLLINHNGALLYDPPTGNALYHQRLSGPLARQVIELARRIDPALGAGVEVLDKLHVDRRDTALLSEPSLAAEAQAIGSLSAVLDAPVTKVVLVGEPTSLANVHWELTRLGQGKLSLGYTHLRLLSVVHARAGKAGALQRVAEHYGVARRRVMSIGDAPNDLDMMAWSGLSVAVANAWEDVREKAHFTVASNDADGVAQALKRFVLIR